MIPNVRLAAPLSRGAVNFPLCPVAGMFDVLDHNGIPRPASSRRLHDKAVAARLTHTCSSAAATLHPAIRKAIVSAGWLDPVFLGIVPCTRAGAESTSAVFGTRKLP